MLARGMVLSPFSEYRCGLEGSTKDEAREEEGDCNLDSVAPFQTWPSSPSRAPQLCLQGWSLVNNS